jgi:hypothetical protein
MGRWTYNDEFGPASGLVEKYPTPKRTAIVDMATPWQRLRVHWSILSYANREVAFPKRGSTSGRTRAKDPQIAVIGGVVTAVSGHF